MALLRFGVSPRDLLAFTAYVVVCLAGPGVLLIRALLPGRRTAAEEAALGLALGYALETLAYIAARAAGPPLLVLAWPATVYALFLAWPALRGHWRRPSRRPAPLWWSWALALTMVYLLALAVATFLRGNALTWPALAFADADMPYHLALIGELRHHMPPMSPMVAGEPLSYHWFVYAHFAAASRITGVEPLVLLFRLGMPPMMAALVVLLAMIGRRVTGSSAGALVALAGTVLMTAPNLYRGANIGTFTWRGFQSWTSPSQTFGALLFALLALVAIELLRSRARDPRAWLLYGVFCVAVTGAKATHLPPLAAGLALVAAVRAIRSRRPPWPELAMLGLTLACAAYAQFVLFGGARLAMGVDPLSLLRRAWGELTGHPGAVPPAVSVAGITALYLSCLAVTWGGMLGLGHRPRLFLRPDVTLLLGTGAASVGAVLLLGHPAAGQLYFFGAAYPYLMIVAAFGLVTAVRRAALPARTVTYAAGAGVVCANLVRLLCDVRSPLPAGQPDGVLYRPYAVLAVVAVTAVAVVFRLRRARRRAGAWACLLVAFCAVGWPAAWTARALSVVDPVPPGTPTGVPPVAADAVPQGLVPAARWLRAHAAPDDLVATNAHCRWGYADPCDTRQFWVSALTERRVLAEGWAYTETNQRRWRPGEAVENLPFWDAERLRLNDLAFTAPSAEGLRLLRDRYGVRWLMADERSAASPAVIGRVAALRFRSGDYAVYRLP
ncbi:hypothetical protein F5972_17955 [Microbispora cellulosiformans]|uniref:Uncharacterized protein n=1 Tax=Microbispora cellulosiformans TaxID=2614688 RepID=A0A5J5K1W3_9ACTN|nr:hypothetical protein [Microbispora cellulosiformans]KAA9377521.1 hypothetical protein F5972_17955 [Microbispora cellulosiformans]